MVCFSGAMVTTKDAPRRPAQSDIAWRNRPQASSCSGVNGSEPVNISTSPSPA
jgi:hypothetical protein